MHIKALVIGLGLAALIGCFSDASENVGSKSPPGSRDNPINSYTPEDSNPTSTPFPALSEAVDGICLDWQLDSVNSELAWLGYRAGVRSAPRDATPQEIALCRELGYKTQKEHCEAWYQDGVRPPFVGEAVTRTTIARSCREANSRNVLSTSAPSPTPSPAIRLALPTAGRLPQWYETGEFCDGPGLLPSFETNIGPGDGVPYRFTLMDIDSRSVHVVLRVRVEHLPDLNNPSMMHKQGRVPRFALEIPQALRYDSRGMLRWHPAIGMGDGISPEHALWYPDCKGPREILKWDRCPSCPSFEQGGSGIFEWALSYPLEAQNMDLNFRVGIRSKTAFTLNIEQLAANPTQGSVP